ncbi:YvcK family protein [Candidatus Saccharibacteria bacterium]|nr:YvcK family protein [Candidatus Saccharibacteria bacterium]
MSDFSNARIVVIGGGTGSFTLLKSLKKHTEHITALVNMVDDGGSTGVLRDELGVLPPGDVRQCLVALSETPLLRDLFSYRFEEGTFAGHAFGNLFMAGLEKVTGSFHEAVEEASRVLNITGAVEPTVLNELRLCVKLPSGKTVRGQNAVDTSNFESSKPDIWLEPMPMVNPAAVKAIDVADLIIIAPGNLYSSLAPALMIAELAEALQHTKAPKLYVCNLVTKPGQTDGFMVSDFASEIERFVGSKLLDYVLYNTREPGHDLLKKYASQGEYWVQVDESILEKAHYRAVGVELVGDIFKPSSKADLLPRTLIRHDSDTVARAIEEIYRGSV